MNGPSVPASTTRFGPRALTMLRRITAGCRWVSACVILAVLTITGVDVIMRYVLARPLEWTITLSMAGLIAIVILAVPDLEANAEHISMDLFYRKFSPLKKVVADWVTCIATAGFCLISGVAAARTTAHFASAHLLTSGTFNIPIWVGYALLSLGLLLTALTCVLRFALRREYRTEASEAEGSTTSHDANDEV